MLGSDLTDRTQTGPFLGSHLSNTVRRTAGGRVRQLSVGPYPTDVNRESNRTESGPSNLNRALGWRKNDVVAMVFENQALS
jgi:hypothetical protein